MKTLRLLVTKECNRDCEGCCNKDWDLDNLPVVEHFNYDEITLTGGEPLLNPERLIGLIEIIKIISSAKIYVYTALTVKNRTFKPIYDVINYVDGITLTLHNQKDADNFNHVLYSQCYDLETYKAFFNKSLRLNVFKGITYKRGDALKCGWIIKDNIEWIKDCPLPENEVFMRLKNI